MSPRPDPNRLPLTVALVALLAALSLPSTQAVDVSIPGPPLGGSPQPPPPAIPWRYLFVGSNDFADFPVHAGFVSPSYIETPGWSDATLPFHTSGDTACGFSGNTDFAANDMLLVRKLVAVPAGDAQVDFNYRADNDIWLWVDSNLVFEAAHGFCDGYQTETYALPGSSSNARQVLVAVLVRDLGSPGFFDMTISTS